MQWSEPSVTKRVSCSPSWSRTGFGSVTPYWSSSLQAWVPVIGIAFLTPAGFFKTGVRGVVAAEGVVGETGTARAGAIESFGASIVSAGREGVSGLLG